jgi:AraC family transcriptional regulator
MPSTATTIHEERAVPAQRGQLPGAIRGFLWPTEFLMFTDTLVATPHQHSALQLVVGLDGLPRVKLDGTWHYPPGVLIDTDVPHALRSDGALAAIGWIEGESRAGQHLRERVLAGRPYAVLDQTLSARLAEALRPALAADASCDDAHAWWRRALGELAPGIAAEAKPDRRIAAVLEHLRSTPSPPPSIADLTRIAYLSESWLQHVFREQVGVPIRRYLLWHRYLTALSLLADGSSVTDAAYAAGFADSAHLARTAVRMNGGVPTDLRFSRWLTSCR